MPGAQRGLEVRLRGLQSIFIMSLVILPIATAGPARPTRRSMIRTATPDRLDPGAAGGIWGNGREAATRRNRTYQKCSSPHGKGPHRLVVCGVVDVKVREQLILMLEDDSADSSAGSGSGPHDFPEGGEPALFDHDNPGKHSLGASSARELPGPNLKTEISVGRSSLCCALSQLPSRYPSWTSDRRAPDCGPRRCPKRHAPALGS